MIVSLSTQLKENKQNIGAAGVTGYFNPLNLVTETPCYVNRKHELPLLRLSAKCEQIFPVYREHVVVVQEALK
jgi:hypothetical protein